MADPEIINWYRYSDGLTTSGQPNEAQLKEIAALGVNHVINLALHTHELALPDEAASAAALGMRYTHIPVAFDAPTEADFDAFCLVMEAHKEEIIHVHCIMNWRVTAFLYRYQRDVLHIDEPESRSDMEHIWSPSASDDPRARVWVAFLAPR